MHSTTRWRRSVALLGPARSALQLAVLALATAAPAQELLLRHALVPGSSFAYALTVQSKSQQTMSGRTLDVDMRFVLHFAATVRTNSAGTAIVPHRLHRVEAKATT